MDRTMTSHVDTRGGHTDDNPDDNRTYKQDDKQDDKQDRTQGNAQHGERGAGTVLVLGLAAVVLLLGVGLAALGSAQQARASAQSAADLGALAGATAIQHGFDPCSAARAVVARNGATVASCIIKDGGIVELAATTGVRGVPAWAGGMARSTARAGPRE
jgi:secretion/DNA translocation related TadE-like protein